MRCFIEKAPTVARRDALAVLFPAERVRQARGFEHRPCPGPPLTLTGNSMQQQQLDDEERGAAATDSRSDLIIGTEQVV